VTRTSYHVATRDGAQDDGYYSDPPLLVLVSLADGPKHGHSILLDILEMSGTRLGPGTLYGAIARLERDGLIESLEPDERRRPYRLTAAGKRVLRAQLSTLQRFVKVGLKRLEA
jgi:DNA-binding PadR family transcriptional regulator